MRFRVSSLLDGISPSRHWMVAGVIFALAAIFMLSGVASRIVSTHDGLLSSDRLAAISQIISGVPDSALPVTLLDVDDASRRAWRAQTTTPHGPLAELVRIAAGKGARAILVDFELTAGSDGDTADPAMAELLKSYPADAPLLMLVRSIGFVRSEQPDGSVAVQAATAPASLYDGDTVGKDNIVWVTTLNDIGSDRTVRRIRLWQSVCDGKDGVAFPSAALVTAAHLVNGGGHREDMNNFLRFRVAKECGNEPGTQTLKWPPVQQQAAVLPFVLSGSSGSHALLRADVNGTPTVILRRISAALLVSYENGKAQATGEIDRDPFAGRAVVLGASYTDSRDVYETPLGTMPGSVILANSIVQAETLTETVPASFPLRALIALAGVLIFVAFARYFVGIIVVLFVCAASLIGLIVVSRMFGYESGLDVLIMTLTGYAMFKLIDGLALIVMTIPKRGWRAFLKS